MLENVTIEEDWRRWMKRHSVAEEEEMEMLDRERLLESSTIAFNPAPFSDAVQLLNVVFVSVSEKAILA